MARVLRFHGWALALLCLGVLWTCWPMYTVLWWDSHETNRYPLRLSEYLDCWRAGYWYPRWGPNLYAGAGYPFFNFYAPAIFFLSACFCSLGASTVAGLKLAVTLLALLAAVTAYGMAYGETGRRGAALFAAGLYVYLPYRSVNVYGRGNLAEYAAFAFLPLAIWGYRALTRARTKRAAMKAATAAAVGHAGVLFGHSLIGFYSVEIVAFLVLIQLWRERSAAWRPSWLAVAALAGALGLAAIYIMPAYLERDLVHSERTTLGFAKSYLHTIGIGSMLHKFFTPGLPFLVISLWFLLGQLHPAWRARLRPAAGWLALSWVLYSLLFHWAVPFWKYWPYGVHLQFPWRLLGFVGLFGAGAAAHLWAGSWQESRRELIAAGLCVILMPLDLRRELEVVPMAKVPVGAQAVRAENVSTSCYDEYMPLAVGESYPERKASAWSKDPAIHVLNVEEVNGLDYRLDVQADRRGEVVVGIFDYQGWKATGGAHLITGPEGFIHLSLSDAGRYQLRVYLGSTPLRTTAAIISFLTALCFWPCLGLIADECRSSVRRRPLPAA